MTATPQTDRDNYTKMLQSLRVYRQVGGLLNMTREQLENMPKEVMISLAPNEIALIWDKLPDSLKNDGDMLEYRFCYEHYSSGSSEDSNEERDEGDGPIPRKLYCCYCKIKDVKIKAQTCVKRRDERQMKKSFNYLSCCKRQ